MMASHCNVETEGTVGKALEAEPDLDRWLGKSKFLYFRSFSVVDFDPDQSLGIKKAIIEPANSSEGSNLVKKSPY